MLKLSKNDRFWLSISHKCNNQCIFCHDVNNQADGVFFNLAEIIDQIDQAWLQGAKRLIVSGGEASINPDFIEIIKYAKDLGFKEIQTITNGRYFYYSKFCQEAISAGLSEITFSLHGHNEKLHDSMTGVEGSFKQALTGLDNVRQFPQVIVNIDIVINKLNYQYLYDIIQFYAQNYGVYEFDLLQIVPFGRAWENRETLFYDLGQARPHLAKVFDLAKNDSRFHLWTNRFPAEYLEGYEFLIQDPHKLYDDVFGRQKMLNNFLIKGEIMPCHDEVRCKLCNLGNFCAKLIDLSQGDLALKLEKMTINPFCLNLPAPDCQLDFADLDGKIDLGKFVDFYIENLDKVKSLRCQQCLQNKDCYGASINLIREDGFKILKPISR